MGLKHDVQTEAILRATKLGNMVTKKIDDAWGDGPMTYRMTPREARQKLQNDPAFRQQALAAVGPDPILQMMLGIETKRAMGVPLAPQEAIDSNAGR